MSIPATRAAALEELVQINRELGHAAAQVSPELHLKSVRAGYLIGCLQETALGTPWPTPREEPK